MGKEADGEQCYFERGIKGKKGPGYRAPWVRISRRRGRGRGKKKKKKKKGGGEGRKEEGRCMVGRS